MSHRMNPTAIDHVVLTVPDVERTLAWWRDELGLEPVRVDEWRRGILETAGKWQGEFERAGQGEYEQRMPLS